MWQPLSRCVGQSHHQWHGREHCAVEGIAWRASLRVIAEADGGGVLLRTHHAAGGTAELPAADQHAIKLHFVVAVSSASAGLV